ncbi:MAG: phosphatidate cytidylyltransferase [Anaerolineales bacterium]|nr:phosphatidate cytidylyltransferase [Anaerolineales bacterium]
MLRVRLAVILLLVPLGFWVIASGGWMYMLVITGFLAQAASEYGNLFANDGHRPAQFLLVVGVALLSVCRFLFGFEHSALVLSILLLVAMAWHEFDFERGAPNSGTDFAITVTGILYVGWLGSYLISLRQLVDGEWWLLLMFTGIWLADGSAYMLGRLFGKHKLSRRLSPNKTWEGYLGGLLIGSLSSMGLATIWALGASPDSGINAITGLVVGFLVALVAPLGDFGVSMFKREVDAKDSSHLIPGHGGMLDRMDSWLWAGVIAYYLVPLLQL